MAKKARWKAYPDDCRVCGKETDHSVSEGKCQVCEDGESTPARKQARRDGEPRYLDTCPKHGLVAFSTTTGKCLMCFRSDGLARTPKSNRAVARSQGQKVFRAFCNDHGRETDHWVSHGGCCDCWNSGGVRRPGAPSFEAVAPVEPRNFELSRLLLNVGCTPIIFAELSGVVVEQVFNWIGGTDPTPDYAMLIARTLTADIVERNRYR